MKVNLNKDNIKSLIAYILNSIVDDIIELANDPEKLLRRKLSIYHITWLKLQSMNYCNKVKMEIMQEMEDNFFIFNNNYFYFFLYFLYGDPIAKKGVEKFMPTVKKAQKNLPKFIKLLDETLKEKSFNFELVEAGEI